MIQITDHEVERWLKGCFSQTGVTVELCLELITEIANDQYDVDQLRQDILQYGRNR